MANQQPLGLTTTKTKTQSAQGEFRDTLLALAPEIQKALPKHIDPDVMLRVVLTTVRRTPGLLACTRESVLGAIMQCAQLGLPPDGMLGLAYLLPYGNTCQLIVGYKGLIELARRSGKVASIRAHVVHRGDYFKYELGLKPALRHVPQDMLEFAEQELREQVVATLAGESAGSSIIAAYAVVDLTDGTQHFEVVTKKYIDKIKRTSKSASSSASPWNQWEDQMWMKTAIKVALKFVPLSPEDRELIERMEKPDYIKAAEAQVTVPKRTDNGAQRVVEHDLGDAPEAPPAEQPVRQRRKRRTKAEMQAAHEAEAPEQPDLDDSSDGEDDSELDNV